MYKKVTTHLLFIIIFILGNCQKNHDNEKTTIKIITIGDSITKGVREGVKHEETFTFRLMEMLRKEGVRIEVINAGIPYERTDLAIVRLEEDVIRLKPDIVTIMYGTNDAFIDEREIEPRLAIDEFEKNLHLIITQLKDEGIHPVLMTEPPLGQFWNFNREPYISKGPNFLMEKYMETCRRIASEEKILLVDNYKFWSEKIETGLDIEQWLTDGCHPNPEGHKVIAETIFPVLKSQLYELDNLTEYIENDEPLRPKKYTIPIIDISDETRRQVIIDKEDGQYLGHPTTVLLEDNKTMIIVYPKGHGRGAIVMKRSNDAGLTWSDRLHVPENWSTSLEVPTIYRTEDKNGVKRLIMFSGLYPIRMAYSEDDGFTWTQLEPIGDFGGIVAMGDVIRLNNGKYMAFFHDDGRFFSKGGKWANKFFVYKTISKDGGLTWGSPKVVTTHNWAHLCEPGLIRSPGGNQLAMLLRENSRKYNSMVVFSNDEGNTWSEPSELPASLTGDRHQCLYAPDGRIVVAFRDVTGISPTKGDFVAWVGTYDDIVNDNEGQYRIRLLDNKNRWDCGYPGLELLPDGTFIATTYGHWDEGEEPYIKSVRFKLEEIDEKAKSEKL